MNVLDVGQLRTIVADLWSENAPNVPRAGVIGGIGLSWPVHPDEEKVLHVAVRAQVLTGAPLLIHPGRNEAAPIEAMEVVLEEGGVPERTVIAHIDRTLLSIETMVQLAKLGCFVEFDLFGQEFSYYPLAPIDMPNDARRIDYILALLDAGYGEQLLISMDICQKVYYIKYGGRCYSHIIENVIPMMILKGMNDADIPLLKTTNPQRLLAWRGQTNT